MCVIQGLGRENFQVLLLLGVAGAHSIYIVDWCMLSCRQVTVVKGSCIIQCQSTDGCGNSKELLLKEVLPSSQRQGKGVWS